MRDSASFSSLRGRVLGAVVLPRGVAGDVPPLADASRRRGRRPWRRPCGRPWRPRVVGLRVLAAERLPARRRRHDVLLVLRQPVEDRLRHHQRLEHEPVGLPAPVVRRFDTSSRRNEIRLVEEVMPASSRRSASPRRFRSTASTAPRRRPPSASGPSRASRRAPSGPWRLPARRRLGAAGHAAGLPDPGHHHDALVGQELGQLLADRRPSSSVPCS